MPATFFFKNTLNDEMAWIEAVNSDIALEECLKDTHWPPDRIIYLGKGSEAQNSGPPTPANR